MKSNLTEPQKNNQSALAALIGAAEPLDFPSRKGQSDLIPQEGKRPAASPVSSVKLIAEQASTTEQTLQEFYGRRYDAYNHWGLNE
jgi:hypothetical protein